MPPVSPAGSRTAAVTWAVVVAIVAVAMAIVAIYFYADANKSRDALETHRKAVAEVSRRGVTDSYSITETLSASIVGDEVHAVPSGSSDDWTWTLP